MNERASSREIPFSAISGWPMVALFLTWAAVVITLFARQVSTGDAAVWAIVALPVSIVAILVCLAGFFVINPNQSRVLVLFGRYRGTRRVEGFYWTNPFTMKHAVSLRANNLASQKIKVNDLVGNPIEIGAVVVWQVRDTAQAMFDVENYHAYVDVQIETAVRQLAKAHPYDEGQGPPEIPTLRGDTEEMTTELQQELQSRLERAGVLVLEARVSHLAYAAEIASAMLQRQQAAAVVAAREKIVEGAVSMVEHALADLSKRGVVQLDDERRATLVGNLLVVLCSHAPATPVLNTGSLYT